MYSEGFLEEKKVLDSVNVVESMDALSSKATDRAWKTRYFLLSNFDIREMIVAKKYKIV